MLGLRFFACEECETVFAGPEKPPWCDSCDGDSFEEITHRLQANAYLTPS